MRIIWQYWHADPDRAPPLIKACLHSVRQHLPQGYEQRILSDRTVRQWVDIPQVIEERRRSGALSVTHFSDYLRVALLERYGGVWLDASVYLSAALPPAILEARWFFFLSNLFFQYPGLVPWELLCSRIPPTPAQVVTQHDRRAGSSFALVARRGSCTPALLRQLLECYWRRETQQIDYFLFHYLQTWLLYNHRGCAAEYAAMPRYCCQPLVFLSRQLLRPYSPALMAALIQASFLHKLTWKLPAVPRTADCLLNQLLDREAVPELRR